MCRNLYLKFKTLTNDYFYYIKAIKLCLAKVWNNQKYPYLKQNSFLLQNSRNWFTSEFSQEEPVHPTPDCLLDSETPVPKWSAFVAETSEYSSCP